MTDRILRKAEVLFFTGLSHTTLWRLEQEGQFPRRVLLSKGAVGWRASEVEAWIAERQAAAGPAVAATA